MTHITINTLGKTLSDEDWCDIANDYGVVISIYEGSTFTQYSPGQHTKHVANCGIGNTFRNDVYEFCEEISDYEKSRPTDED